MNSFKRKTKSDIVFEFVNISLLVIIVITVLYPLLFILSASVSDPEFVNTGQVVLFPKGFTLKGYEYVFMEKTIWWGYRNTFIYLIIGTSINLFITFTCGYALAQKKFIGKKFITLMFIFTMFFNGGMIPRYLVVQNLNLYNTLWAMVLPNAVQMFYVIIVRTFISNSIPTELYEAARMDGCSHFRIFTNIVMPLVKPIMAVMILYYAVMHWNSFFPALLYLRDEEKFPLQLVLRNILIENTLTETVMGQASVEAEQQNIADLMRYGLIVVSTIPILTLYPFVQKYFTKGVMIGAVKG